MDARDRLLRGYEKLTRIVRRMDDGEAAWETKELCDRMAAEMSAEERMLLGVVELTFETGERVRIAT